MTVTLQNKFIPRDTDIKNYNNNNREEINWLKLLL